MMSGDIIRAQVELWTQHGLNLITAEAPRQEKNSIVLSIGPAAQRCLFICIWLKNYFWRGKKHLMNNLRTFPSRILIPFDIKRSTWMSNNWNCAGLLRFFKSGNVWLIFEGNKVLTDCQKQQERPVWAERRRGRWFGCCSSRSGGSSQRCRALVERPATPLRCTPSSIPQGGKTCCFWNADRGGSVECAHFSKE